ncbi:MAG TPA: RNA methyltransferase [Phnomibacter sp.]|nr:RNA methyltransferase [Phnomibacter sp.]
MLNRNDFTLIQQLQQRKNRQSLQLFVAEGPKILAEFAAGNHFKIHKVYAIQEALAQIPAGLPTTVVRPHELKRLSQLQTPQDVVSLVQLPTTTFSPIPARVWSIGLDELQDPGNLGSIIRLADWFGIQHIYCTDNTVDCFNAKVVQATMGSLGRVQVHYGPLSKWLLKTEAPVYGTTLQGNNLYTQDTLPPGIIVFGNEGKGITPNILACLSHQLTIPRIGQAESLNAAVAAGIVLGHLLQPSLRII